MNKDSLLIRELHVHRLYGLDHEGLAATDLASGVNVIYGPNGRGKTTFGRAVHALLWPDSVANHSPLLHGHLAIGDDDWRVDLDAGSVRHQRAGIDAPPPPLPESGHQPRYVLSLHELVGSDGRPFAETIRRDAAGGMDVAAAAEALGFTASSPRSGKATAEAKAAWQKLDEVRKEQGALENKASGVGFLRKQLEEAEAAQQEEALFGLAVDHAEARAAADAARRALEELPPALANVREDDAETLHTLREKIQAAEGRRASATRDAEAASARLEENLVVRSGRPDTPMAELEEHLRALQKDEDLLGRHAEEIARARAEEDEAWRELGEGLDAEQAARVDASALGPLDGFVGKVLRLQGEERAQEALDRVGQEVGASVSDRPESETVEEGVRTLREWLRTGHPALPPALRTVAVAGAVGSAALGLALGFTWHPAAFLLVAAAVLLGLIAARLPTASTTGSEEVQTRYVRLSLPAPEWTTPGVETRLAELEREQAAHAFAGKVREHIAARRTDETRLGEMKAEVEAERRRLADTLGVDVEAQATKLVYTVKALQAWQNARRARQGAEAARRAAEDRIADRLERVGALLAPFELEAPGDSAALADRIGTLREAYDACAAADRDLKDAENQAGAARGAAAESQAEVTRLFERLDIPESAGDAAVEQACVDHAEFAAREEEAAAARTRASAAADRLRAHEGFDEALLDLSAEEAAARRSDAADRASERDELAKQITRLEEQVRQARQGRALEEADAEHRAALDRLRGERDDAAAARVGQLLADRVARTASEQQLPPVLRRARELFSAITKHRFELAFDAVDGRFVARDTVLDRGFTLDQLSSGTRVQLLLSVRVAFVEQQELGVRLPLVLDEVLANSDEERAHAIAEAVLHLCREGRQAFYLTAQRDEVDKWRRLAAANPDVVCCFVALDGTRTADEVDADALPDMPLSSAIPEPGEQSHADYGVALGVPAWDGWRPTDELHLWYVLECPHQLYTTLVAGVSRLGPLLSAARHGASNALGLDSDATARARILADALQAWQEAWRVGRGLPVDRAKLEACDAVSDRFIDRVAEYNASIGDDGRALVEGLLNGDVKGFRTKQAEELGDYLREHGYIDDTDCLSKSAIWTRVVARVGPRCTNGLLGLDDVRTFLARITDGPPVIR